MTAASTRTGVRRSGLRLPVLQGILPLDRSHIGSDIVAGITLAALGIPEVMGYTKIAGMPVITGLYTILIPIAVFAVLGSSRHLVVGADSATAAVMAAGMAGLAATGSADYVSLASVLAILTAAILLLARFLRLGFVANWLSRSVLIGFLTGVGIQVAMGQVSGMFGVPAGSGGTVEKFLGTLRNLPDTNLWTLGVTVGVLGTIVILRRVNRRIPGALIAVVGAIVASSVLALQTHGVAVLGPVPSGLPRFGLPDWGWDLWQTLLPTAGAMFLVILAQSAATSRAYAARYEERFDEDLDLVGLGLANVAAGLSGTFVVNGSPTKTQMVTSAGGRSELAQLVTALIVLVVLLFLTGPLEVMPQAVLAAIVFMIGVELIDEKGMRGVLARRRDEFVIAALTAIVVVVVGVMQGILLAIVLSVVDHLRFSYRPVDGFVVPQPGGGRTITPLARADGPVDAAPGLVIYRFAADLYYANADRFAEELRGIVATKPAPAWICLDMGAVGDLDYTAGNTLQSMHDELRRSGVRFVIAEASDRVRAELERDGTLALFGTDGVFASIEDAVAAFGDHHEGILSDR
jgi:sulfate permease, SulP family